MEGVLVRSRGPWLILADASALKAGQPPMKLPGDIHIPRDDVKFLQVLS